MNNQNISSISTIQSISNINISNNDLNHRKDIQIKEFKTDKTDKTDKVEDINKIKDVNGVLDNKLIKYEVPIANSTFGYNVNSKDFYIKVKRGNVETQYPTDEMMKLKQHFINLNNRNINV